MSEHIFFIRSGERNGVLYALYFIKGPVNMYSSNNKLCSQFIHQQSVSLLFDVFGFTNQHLPYIIINSRKNTMAVKRLLFAGRCVCLRSVRLPRYDEHVAMEIGILEEGTNLSLRFLCEGHRNDPYIAGLC